MRRDGFNDYFFSPKCHTKSKILPQFLPSISVLFDVNPELPDIRPESIASKPFTQVLDLPPVAQVIELLLPQICHPPSIALPDVLCGYLDALLRRYPCD